MKQNRKNNYRITLLIYHILIKPDNLIFYQ